MPTYLFLNKDTQEEFEEFMSISERDKFLEENPHIEQLVLGAPMVTYRVGQSQTKPADSFRDVLRNIKKRAGRTSTIDTY